MGCDFRAACLAACLATLQALAGLCCSLPGSAEGCSWSRLFRFMPAAFWSAWPALSLADTLAAGWLLLGADLGGDWMPVMGTPAASSALVRSRLCQARASRCEPSARSCVHRKCVAALAASFAAAAVHSSSLVHAKAFALPAWPHHGSHSQLTGSHEALVAMRLLLPSLTCTLWVGERSCQAVLRARVRCGGILAYALRLRRHQHTEPCSRRHRTCDVTAKDVIAVDERAAPPVHRQHLTQRVAAILLLRCIGPKCRSMPAQGLPNMGQQLPTTTHLFLQLSEDGVSLLERCHYSHYAGTLLFVWLQAVTSGQQRASTMRCMAGTPAKIPHSRHP